MKRNLTLLTLPQCIIFMVPLNSWQLMLFYIALMFFTLKVATLLSAHEYKWQPAFLYTLTWVGMNFSEFESPRKNKEKWHIGFSSLILGIVLLSYTVFYTEAYFRPIGLFISMLFIFHFGLLDLNAQVWKYFGRNTKPIMNAPWKAKNLAEFWGKRWNMAFRDAVHKCIFTPLKKKFGLNYGMLAVFIFSGIVHEAVISVPAKGGYGGPMIYFLIQFLGLLTQKRTPALNKVWFTWLVLLSPLPLLFHGPFFTNVFIPLTKAMGG